MTTRKKRSTEEERQKILDQIKTLKTTENLSTAEACKKVDLAKSQFYAWTRKSKHKRRRKNRPVLVTSLIPTPAKEESINFGTHNGPTTQQIAEIVGASVGVALRSLFQGMRM